jgi:DNA-directed RNA polymerase subunit RPC12/RpoP
MSKTYRVTKKDKINYKNKISKDFKTVTRCPKCGGRLLFDRHGVYCVSNCSFETIFD